MRTTLFGALIGTTVFIGGRIATELTIWSELEEASHKSGLIIGKVETCGIGTGELVLSSKVSIVVKGLVRTNVSRSSWTLELEAIASTWPLIVMDGGSSAGPEYGSGTDPPLSAGKDGMIAVTIFDVGEIRAEESDVDMHGLVVDGLFKLL